MISVNIQQLKDYLKKVIILNQTNPKPVAQMIWGSHGIGKTEVPKQVASELDLKFIKINSEQLSEEGDIVGYPQIKFELCNSNHECIFVPKNSVEVFKSLGYVPTGETRMEYAAPVWATNVKENSILLIDEINRASPSVMQALMNLILEQSTLSYTLPKGCTIILCVNEGSDYSTNELDPAQKDRMGHIKLRVDHKLYCEYLETKQYPDMLVNFIMSNPEILTMVSPRSLTLAYDLLRYCDKSDREFMFQVMEAHTSKPVSDLFVAFTASKLYQLTSIDNLVKMGEEGIKYLKTLDKGLLIVIGNRLSNIIKHKQDETYYKFTCDLLALEKEDWCKDVNLCLSFNISNNADFCNYLTKYGDMNFVLRILNSFKTTK